MTPGAFVPYFLDFLDQDDRAVPAEAQARVILVEARTRTAAGAAGVGITYSANYGQTCRIRKVYGQGDWFTGTGGSNQAEVMTAMEQLLGEEFADLQGRVRIVPISTMSYESPSYGPHTHDEVLGQDLAAIEDLLDQGWVVLGWQNRTSGRSAYAVGGGVAAARIEDGELAFGPERQQRVQDALRQLATDYPE